MARHAETGIAIVFEFVESVVVLGIGTVVTLVVGPSAWAVVYIESDIPVAVSVSSVAALDVLEAEWVEVELDSENVVEAGLGF